MLKLFASVPGVSISCLIALNEPSEAKRLAMKIFFLRGQTETETGGENSKFARKRTTTVCSWGSVFSNFQDTLLGIFIL